MFVVERLIDLAARQFGYDRIKFALPQPRPELGATIRESALA